MGWSLVLEQFVLGNAGSGSLEKQAFAMLAKGLKFEGGRTICSQGPQAF